MDRQAIIERVAKSCEMEASKGQISNVLEDAGFFELLEAAEEARGTFDNYNVAHEPDREIYRWKYHVEAINELHEAIKKAKGVGKM